VAASNPPLITSSSRESWLEIRGNPQLEFARKSLPKPQIPANPTAAIRPISIVAQTLRNSSRMTHYNPAMRVEELDDTYNYLAFACVGICIGVDELFENKIGGDMLRGVVASHSALVGRVLAFQAKSTSDEAG
jgi:hypothetical protein